MVTVTAISRGDARVDEELRELRGITERILCDYQVTWGHISFLAEREGRTVLDANLRGGRVINVGDPGPEERYFRDALTLAEAYESVTGNDTFTIVEMYRVEGE